MKGGDWIFELNKIWGGTEIFQNRGWGEKEGESGIFESFIGGKIAGDDFKQKTTSQNENEFKNVFMSYIINYLSKSSFL